MMKAGGIPWLMLVAFTLCEPATATPFVPRDDAEVLEQLPDRKAAEHRDLERLRAAALAAPGDVDAAVALADGYYRISRREGDPRYLGYAQAALAPWWQKADAPTSALVMRAVIRQSNHEFELALADLDKAIAREPGNARAILVKATIQTVQGNYAEARADCGKLQGLTQDLYVLTCIAGADALTGKARAIEDALAQTLATSAATAEARSWIESLRGEIAHRQGDATAEAHFKAALAADRRDLYALGVYCDFLLDQKRFAEVIPLVENEQRVDGLLLRLALAQKGLGLPEAQSSVAILRDRFEASRARGDSVHRREEARFQLWLNGDKDAALRLALDNWQVQREPADLRILAEAARAKADVATLDTVRQWLAETKLEYSAVAELVK